MNPQPTASDLPSSQSLPTGTHLEEFIIEQVLGIGGFGITYLAQDSSLGRRVVIKENLPTQFCWRETSSLTVQPHHSKGEDADNFQYSLESFSKEASTLASLDHPGIVKVLRSFKAHGTAYFVMPFVDGSALDDVLRHRTEQKSAFTENEIKALLTKVLEPLGYLHDRGIYHRDIKPGNILVTKSGEPVLIDFGAARQRLSERSLTVIESAGYTPFEQLQSRGKVGPWSDIYALGGTLYKVITGETPAKANDRAFDDPQVPLAQRAELRGRYSARLLESIDKAMAPKAADRLQDTNQWREQIRPSGPASPSPQRETSSSAPQNRPSNHKPSSPEKIRSTQQDNGFSSRWYYKIPRTKAVIGAISQEQLIARIKAGLVKPDYLVLNEEQPGTWKKLTAVPGLVHALKPMRHTKTQRPLLPVRQPPTEQIAPSNTFKQVP
jgi:serine/threonine protein kinase